MSNNKREHYIQIRLSDEEKELLEKKFKSSRASSKSQFVRRMVIDGVVIRLEEEKLTKIYRAIASTANNINQIAVRVNSTGNFYKEDFAELQKGIDEILRQQRYFQSILLKLRQ